MTRLANNQRGLTLISIAFILSIGGFFVLLGFKIIPIYVNHQNIVSSLDELKKVPHIEEKKDSEIGEALSRWLGINSVYNLNNEDIVIINNSDYLKVTIEYSDTRKLWGNMSVVVSFSDSIKIE